MYMYMISDGIIIGQYQLYLLILSQQTFKSKTNDWLVRKEFYTTVKFLPLILKPGGGNWNMKKKQANQHSHGG